MVLFLAPVIDTSLLDSYIPWADIAYSVLDEMVFYGNLAAGARKSDLQQLESILNQIPFSFSRRAINSTPHTTEPLSTDPNKDLPGDDSAQSGIQPGGSHILEINEFSEENLWENGFTADQLLMVANTLDLDGVDWFANYISPQDLSST